jgi:pyridinium-3,5-bisthiocarboxylic acid mononucleotide nickel chelatase
MSNYLYFELVSGASGDMILSSLIDAGVPVDFLNEQLSKMGIAGLSIDTESVIVNGINCRRLLPKFDVSHEMRHLHTILELIKNGGYNKNIYSSAEKVLLTIANAEAKVHGVPVEKIHFHEIGAVDTIIDVVGVCIALEYLKVSDVFYSSLTEGYGMVSISHGNLPVPVPAVSVMLENKHVTRLDVNSELLTPTGAAILTTLGKQMIPAPSGVIKKTGCSCGSKQFKNHPNILRTYIFENCEFSGDGSQKEKIMIIESDMDHISGEIMGNTAQLLMEKGALDVSWTPVFMKKGRPGYRITVMSRIEECEDLIDLIMINTRTLGVRTQKVDRIISKREKFLDYFLDESVEAKKCSYKGHAFEKPEYEALVSISRKKNIPLIELMEAFFEEKGKENNEQIL